MLTQKHYCGNGVTYNKYKYYFCITCSDIVCLDMQYLIKCAYLTLHMG